MPISLQSMRLRRVAVMMCGTLMVACTGGSPPKPVKARITFVAQSDVNPDATGRASPVVVRVYQLQQDAKFANADFFALFDDEEKVLGPDLMARDEVTLEPGERKQVEFDVKGDAKFVGAIAAYRDIRNSHWRDLQPAPKKGLMNIVKKDGIQVDVARAQVKVTVFD